MHRHLSRRRSERGFTLIELLIVVAIIAILASMLIPNFLRARAQSQVSASKGNLKNIGTALESYFVDKGAYPTTLAPLSPTYIRPVAPDDPCTQTPYIYTTTGSPPTDYELSIDFPAGNQCDNVVDGLSYTPGGGLQETP